MSEIRNSANTGPTFELDTVRGRRNLALFKTGLLGVILIFVGGAVVRNCYSSSSEERARQLLRNLNSAQAIYQSGKGAGNYAPDLKTLCAAVSTSENGILSSIEENAQTIPVEGYLLGSLRTTPRTTATPARYSLTCFPIVRTGWRRTGTDCFYIDETGILRHSGAPDIPAGPDSPPIGN